MWVPGETVNKDVYAVNTGNIAAYVKENVTGILNYTFEKKVGEWDKDCLVLNETAKIAIDGVTTNEAGGYLAWTDTDEELGELASRRQTEKPTTDTRWTPSKTGVYIFRRSVEHDAPGGTLHPADDKFTYAGYYFVKAGDAEHGNLAEDTYYKIVIGNDDFRTYKDGDDDVFDISAPQAKMEGVAIDKDGKIVEGTPKIWFVKEKKVDDQPVSFTYQAKAGDGKLNTDGDHPARLVVEYSAAVDPASAADPSAPVYDASADAANKQVDLVNKKGQFDQDTVEWEQAKADYDYALALANAREELRKAAQKMHDADVAVNGDGTEGSGSKAALDTAWTNLKDAAGPATKTGSLAKTLSDLGITGVNGTDTTTDGISPDELVPEAVRTAFKTTYPSLLGDVDSNYSRLVTLWNEIQADISDINTALATYTGDTKITPEVAREKEEVIATKFAHLATLLKQYEDAYAGIVAEAVSASDLNLGSSTDISAKKATIEGKRTAIYDDTTQKVVIDDTFGAKVTEYVDAYNTNETKKGELTTETANWATAKSTYNTTVGTAKTNYKTIVTKTAGTPQPNDIVNYVDHSQEIVTAYSATRETLTGENPAYDPALVDTNFGADKDFKKDYDYYMTLVSGSDRRTASETATKKVEAAPEYKKFNPTSLKNDDTEIEKLKALDEDLNKTGGSKDQYEAAKKAYETAQATADASSKIKIIVNLADGYDGFWQYDGDMSTTNTTPTQKSEFYYKKLLGAGETSAQLIDSVVLADSVTANDYKNLTFDLNVTLDSAQITYADDQRTITTDAVDANTEAFKLKVQKDHPTSLTDTFSWEDRAPASSTNP